MLTSPTEKGDSAMCSTPLFEVVATGSNYLLVESNDCIDVTTNCEFDVSVSSTTVSTDVALTLNVKRASVVILNPSFTIKIRDCTADANQI